MFFPFRTVTLGALLLWMLVSYVLLVAAILTAKFLYRAIIGHDGNPGWAAKGKALLEQARSDKLQS